MEIDASTLVWKTRGPHSVLGASLTSTKDNAKRVLITTEGEVVEYCLQARKCVHHWAYRKGSVMALRMAAVRNPVSQRYFGVRKAKAGDVLVSWQEDDEDVKKWTSVNVESKTSKVVGIYVHPLLREGVAVVFENGQLECFDDKLEKVLEADVNSFDAEESTEDSEGVVRWAELTSTHRNYSKGVLALSMLVERNGVFELVIFFLGTQGDKKQLAATLAVRHSLQGALPENVRITSCAFHADTLSYSVVCSNGDWYMLSLQVDAMQNALLVRSVRKITTFPTVAAASASTASPHKKRRLSSSGASVETPYYATGVGPYSYLVVMSSSSPSQIVGWDAKFGVQVRSSIVSVEEENDSNALPTSAGASAWGSLRGLVNSLAGELIVIVYEQAVVLAQVKNRRSTLASVLGAHTSQASTVEAPAQPNASVDWATIAQGKVELEQWQAGICSDDADEQRVITDLQSSSIKTATAFEKAFNKAVKEMGKDKTLSYRFLMAITKHCIESADLGLWKPLEVLIQSKHLSARAQPTLLPVLIKHNQLDLLRLTTVSLADIDERSIVRMLRFFLHQPCDKDVSASASNGTSSTSTNDDDETPIEISFVASWEREVLALLSRPTNSVFLQHAVRELQLPEVLVLLAVTKKYLHAQQISSKMEASSNLLRPLPTSQQLCTWICALLDAHFTDLVLHAAHEPAVQQTLRQLDQLVQSEVEVCDGHELLHDVVGTFLAGIKLPQARSIPDYSIEELIL